MFLNITGTSLERALKELKPVVGEQQAKDMFSGHSSSTRELDAVAACSRLHMGAPNLSHLPVVQTCGRVAHAAAANSSGRR